MKQYSFEKKIFNMTITDYKIRRQRQGAWSLCIFFSGSAAQRWLWPTRPRGLHDHTQQRVTVGRTPLEK
jgi:hypothetical protein